MDYCSLFKDTSKDVKIGYINNSYQYIVHEPDMLENNEANRHILEMIIAITENRH